MRNTNYYKAGKLQEVQIVLLKNLPDQVTSGINSNKISDFIVN